MLYLLCARYCDGSCEYSTQSCLFRQKYLSSQYLHSNWRDRKYIMYEIVRNVDQGSPQ